MKVIRAEAMGLCFGVRDALDLARRLPAPNEVTILGELVHNELVLEELDGRGFLSISEGHGAEGVGSPEVLVTAHGMSQKEKHSIRARGKDLIDSTCPLVERAHQAAVRLDREGYHVVVVGRHDHVEVKGLTGDLSRFTVVSCPEEAQKISASKLGIIFQTTTRPKDAEPIVDAIKQVNLGIEVKVVDTICQPTKDRQHAIEDLLTQIDTLVVVGGAHSNNTHQLTRLGLERGIPSYHIQSAKDLRVEWFKNSQFVGLSAGTSTLDTSIDEVHDALLKIARHKSPPMYPSVSLPTIS